VSNDNQYVFAGYADQTATIWDVHTGAIVFDAFEHAETIIQLHVDGNTLRWATSGGAVWEASDTQRPKKLLVTCENWQEALFSPDGQTLLARVGENVSRWIVEKSESSLLASSERRGWGDNAQTLGFDSSGEIFFFPVAPNQLALVTTTQRTVLQRSDRLIHAQFSPSGQMLATDGWSNRVELWAVPGGEILGIFKHDAPSSVVVFSPDSTLLSVGTSGRSDEKNPYDIYVWRVSDQRLLWRLCGHTHQIHSLAFGPDKSWLVSTSLDRTVRLWQLSPNAHAELAESRKLEYEDLEFKSLHVLSDGRILVFRRNCIEVWRDLSELLLRIPAPHPFRCRWRVTSDKHRILITMDAQRIGAWSLEDGMFLRWYEADIARPDQMLTPNLIRQIQPMALGYLWRSPSGNYVHIGNGPRGWATSLRLSDDGRLIAIPCVDGAALVDLDETPRLVSLLPFEGRMRASCIAQNRVLMVNSAGRVFAADYVQTNASRE
jgi:WD40 repeat protein